MVNLKHEIIGLLGHSLLLRVNCIAIFFQPSSEFNLIKLYFLHFCYMHENTAIETYFECKEHDKWQSFEVG